MVIVARIVFFLGILLSAVVGTLAYRANQSPFVVTIAGRAYKVGSVAVASASTSVAPLGVLRGAQSLTAGDIDVLMSECGSPASGTGSIWISSGERWNIDAAYAVAFFVHESTCGTNGAWAGLKADGSTTHNIGNIICAGYATCYGRFRDYDSWQSGIDDWFRLISVEYLDQRGFTTVREIIPVYAPSVENDVGMYQNVVDELVDTWRNRFAHSSAEAHTARSRAIRLALQQVGKPYVYGAIGPNEFDCSGLVQWVYAQQGITTGRTTFDQLDYLKSIEQAQVQQGDLVYFQFPSDQHVGFLDDLDGDGRLDMVHAGSPEVGVIITYDVFSDPFFSNAIIGFRTVF